MRRPGKRRKRRKTSKQQNCDVDTAVSNDIDPAPEGIWTTESIGGVFPGSRLRKILDAHDALTLAEKRVYAVLWGNDASDDRIRVASKGYDLMAKESQVTKRNVAKIIQRLINKGFLQLILPPVVSGERTPATYLVISSAAVREDQVEKRREWVIRTGRGIDYARKLSDMP